MKKPARTKGKTRKHEPRRAVEISHNPELCAAFQARYARGETVKTLCAEFKIPQSTAYTWAKDIKRAAADCLRARGWDEDKLVERWIAQAKRSRGHVHNGALREIGSILDAYPAKKEPEPARGPVTVIFNTNIEAYKEHRYASTEIGFGRSLPQESQGNAGSGTPEESVSRGRVLDTKKNGSETKA